MCGKIGPESKFAFKKTNKKYFMHVSEMRNGLRSNVAGVSMLARHISLQPFGPITL